MSQANYLQIVISGLQRTAGPYRSAIRVISHRSKAAGFFAISDEPLYGTSMPGADAVYHIRSRVVWLAVILCVSRLRIAGSQPNAQVFAHAHIRVRTYARTRHPEHGIVLPGAFMAGA